MRSWVYMLGGLIVWAACFILAYVAASSVAAAPVAQGLIGAFSAVGLVATATLFVRAMRQVRSHARDDGAWPDKVAMLSAGSGFLALLWQGLAAIIQ